MSYEEYRRLNSACLVETRNRTTRRVRSNGAALDNLRPFFNCRSRESRFNLLSADHKRSPPLCCPHPETTQTEA
jgi:hypothetical protein